MFLNILPTRELAYTSEGALFGDILDIDSHNDRDYFTEFYRIRLLGHRWLNVDEILFLNNERASFLNPIKAGLFFLIVIYMVAYISMKFKGV